MKKILSLLIFLLVAVSTTNAEIIAGYQGWFGCPNDFENNKDWQHWFHKGQFTVDLLPDISIYPEQAFCDTGIKTQDGKTVKLFSSQSKEVVKVHVNLAEQYGIEVLALQRFVNEISREKGFKRRNNVLQHIIDTTKGKNIKFFIMYDISGAEENKVYDLIDKDITFLKEKYGLFILDNYYRVNGKPLIGIWGFGFKGRPGQPSDTLSLLKNLKRSGFSLLGGIPSRWRTLGGDSKSDNLWLDVYLQYDILSPWMVGRFKDEVSMKSYYENIVKQDIAFLKDKGKKYLPVVFPGFSWYNLQNVRGNQAEFNHAPRHCGLFLEKQFTALKKIGVKDFYLAMLDEFDEGTALLPTVINSKQLPENDKWKFVIPEYDNCKVSSPFYMIEKVKSNK